MEGGEWRVSGRGETRGGRCLRGAIGDAFPISCDAQALAQYCSCRSSAVAPYKSFLSPAIPIH
eukprot:1600549-Rhodomonas_salina.2